MIVPPFRYFLPLLPSTMPSIHSKPSSDSYIVPPLYLGIEHADNISGEIADDIGERFVQRFFSTHPLENRCLSVNHQWENRDKPCVVIRKDVHYILMFEINYSPRPLMMDGTPMNWRINIHISK